LPFLIFITAAAAVTTEWLGGDEPARDAVGRIDSVLSDKVAMAAEEQVRQVLNSPNYIVLGAAFVASIWTGLIGGQSVVRQLNAIHGLEDSRGRREVVAVALAVSFGSSVAVVAAVAVLLVGGGLPSDFAGGAVVSYLLSLLRWPVALLLLTLAAAVAYRLAPARKQRPIAISAGALLFGLVWTIASGLLVVYATNADTLARTYGALTGIVVMLAWVYVTGVAFVAGAVLDAELESGRG
jgi:membrane protein